jgi:tRNA nucleotidyltransferase (CCA-adding enzyme)|nr:CCA tRNA nucleotidyltransferase [Aphanothece sp. CMT-3BRIN-NPC111]
MLRLTYSRAEIEAVTTAIAYLPKLLEFATSEMPVLRQQYFFFQGVGAAFPAVAVLAVASGISPDALIPLINRYFNPEDLLAHPTPLVTGNDLMRALNLRAGPQVGQLLTEIQVARAEGRISTQAEALEFAADLLD